MDYDLRGYAAEVLRPLVEICGEHGLPQPMVFSESGRALTAHHAVLVTEVIDSERPGDVGPGPVEDDDELLQRLARLLDPAVSSSPPQRLQTAQLYLDEAHERFAQGRLDLAGRARAEALFLAVARAVRADLRLGSRRHRALIDRLEDLLADRVFCNFSLFQSLPDVWAIDQVFPLMPLHGLDRTPARMARLHDLTCDSDGCIDHYVDQDGIEAALPLHEPDGDSPYLLGVFLVGAYQEILGDMHNLFGDTDAVNIAVDADGGYRIGEPEYGDSVDELLRYVHFDPEQMEGVYRAKLDEQGVDAQAAAAFVEELHEGLVGYTYFERP
jgi:arginine decarboxylase